MRRPLARGADVPAELPAVELLRIVPRSSEERKVGRARSRRHDALVACDFGEQTLQAGPLLLAPVRDQGLTCPVDHELHAQGHVLLEPAAGGLANGDGSCPRDQREPENQRDDELERAAHGAIQTQMALSSPRICYASARAPGRPRPHRQLPVLRAHRAHGRSRLVLPAALLDCRPRSKALSTAEATTRPGQGRGRPPARGSRATPPRRKSRLLRGSSRPARPSRGRGPLFGHGSFPPSDTGSPRARILRTPVSATPTQSGRFCTSYPIS